MTTEPTLDPYARFRQELREQGAVFPEPFPAPPQHFGHPESEAESTETSDIVYPWLDRGLLCARGEDRAKLLHNFCTNDIKALPRGHVCEAFITDIKSHILAHVLVYADEDRLLLSCAAAVRQQILEHLNRYVITEDAEFTDESENVIQVLLRTAGSEPDEPTGAALEPGQGTRLSVADHDIAACRVSVWNGSTLLALVPASDALTVWHGLLEQGWRPIGSDAAEDLRIAAGFPTDGVDLNPEMLAQEAGRSDQAISFTKGCYLGQEPIARIDALGHVNRVLRRIEIESDACPVPGTPVRTADGAEIGQLRSVSPLVRSGHRSGLALLRTQQATGGAQLQIAADPLPLNARVL